MENFHFHDDTYFETNIINSTLEINDSKLIFKQKYERYDLIKIY